jgi:hypothetical protein
MKLEPSSVKTVKIATSAFVGGIIALRALNSKNIAVDEFARDYLSPFGEKSDYSNQERDALKLAFAVALETYQEASRLPDTHVKPVHPYEQRGPRFTPKQLLLSKRESLLLQINLCLGVTDYSNWSESPRVFRFAPQYLGHDLSENDLVNITAALMIREFNRTGKTGYTGRFFDSKDMISYLEEGLESVAVMLASIHPQAFFASYSDSLSTELDQDMVAFHKLAKLSPIDAIQVWKKYPQILTSLDITDLVNLTPLIARDSSKLALYLLNSTRITAKSLISNSSGKTGKTSYVDHSREKDSDSILMYQKGKAWVCLDEAKGVAMMQRAQKVLRSSANIPLDTALQLHRVNPNRAKQIAHNVLTNPDDKKRVFDAIARDMLLGITKPTPDIEQAMQAQMLSVIPLLAPRNPEQALEYLRQQNPVYLPEYMPYIVASLASKKPERAQSLYEEIVNLADTPAHKENKAIIIGNITAARFGIPPFGNTYDG